MNLRVMMGVLKSLGRDWVDFLLGCELRLLSNEL